MKVLRTFLILAVLGLLAMGRSHAGHGEASAPAAKKEEKTAESGHGGGGHGAAAESTPAEPVYKLGPPLKGHFDRTTLRSTAKIAAFRYPINDIVKSLNLENTWQVRLSCAVEFGSESGMAEIEANLAACKIEIQNAIERFDPLTLMTPAGKLRLKEAIVAGINRRMTTVRARQAYLTDFIVVQGE